MENGFLEKLDMANFICNALLNSLNMMSGQTLCQYVNSVAQLQTLAICRTNRYR